MSKKEDARITRSKRDLRNALMELLKERPFDKITVTDICKKATINKMTFYKYYQDKYTLLDDCIKSVAANIYYACVGSEDAKMIVKNSPVDFFVRLTSSAVTECRNNKEILLSLVYGNNLSLRFIIDSCIHKMMQQLIEKLAVFYEFKYPLPVITDFFIGGFSNIVTECLKKSDFNLQKFNAYSRMFFEDLINNSNIILKNPPHTAGKS